MINAILNHRSIRKFKPTPVDPQLLDELLQAGVRTSNTGNMQAYSIVATTNADLLARLAPCHFNQPASKAPVQLTICADFNRFNKWCNARNASGEYNNFMSFLVSATDALLAAQTIALAAESKGLGICYLGTTLYNAEQIIDILKLPNGVMPLLTLVMGYPDETPPLTDRLPLQAVVHYDTYSDYSEGDIDIIYAEREISEDSLKFIKENGKETLAQVFTDVRYRPFDFAQLSKKLLTLLKKQGFMNE